MKTLLALLTEHQFNVTPTFDGQLVRFDRAGKGTGWFRGVTVQGAGVHVGGESDGSAATLYAASFGDWKTGESFSWRSTDGQTMTPEEERATNAAFEEAAARARDQEAERQENVAKLAAVAWAESIDRGDSPYLTRKCGGPVGLQGTRLQAHDPSTTLVPAQDVSGKLWGYQRVGEDGSKYLLEGMRIRGCFFVVGGAGAGGAGAGGLQGEVILCEGAATGVSLLLALQRREKWQGVVLSCFNAANLANVARAIWEAGVPEGASFTVCADNDQWTLKPSGVPWNPGLEYAREAAKVLGARVLAPAFKSLEGRPTDFNDLHMREGLGEVTRQLFAQEDGAEGDQDTSLGRPPRALPPRRTAQGKQAAPTQQAIVDHLLDHFGGNLIKQDRDLFWYTGTHWKWLKRGNHDHIKQIIQEAAGGMLAHHDIVGTYGLLMIHLPTPPDSVDMLVSTPACANFLNGTLHLVKNPPTPDGGPGAGYKLVFAPHKKEDYLLNVLPYEYKEGDTTRNAEFDAMLARLFQGEEDAKVKERALAQMFGACLMPAFPRLFMLHGDSGSGKSTVLQIARRMVSPENISHVPPSEFHGFHMETMAGKLVNIDTDIPLTEPIRDEVVKKIIERRPFRVNRKGLKEIECHIPAVHLFGGNGIPRALDGASGAHTRRWTFLEFKQFQPTGNYLLEYWDYCFELCPQGILNFALAGLKDLCDAGGHFVQPASGAEALQEWQLASDPVGEFLEELAKGIVVEGSSRLMRGPGAQIERKKFYEAYKTWFSDSHPGRRALGKFEFYRTLRRKKVKEKLIKGYAYFDGVGVFEGGGMENTPRE